MENCKSSAADQRCEKHNPLTPIYRISGLALSRLSEGLSLERERHSTKHTALADSRLSEGLSLERGTFSRNF